MEKKLIELGKKYKTKDGRNVKILQFINNEDYPIVAVITEEDGTEDVKGYTKYGTFYKNTSCDADLFEQPEVVTKELWLELTKSGDVYVWKTFNCAEESKDEFTIAIKKITVEFTEGEGL